MISSITTASDSEQKSQVEVPAEILPRLNRATELLDRELERLSSRFGITVEWKVYIRKSGLREIELNLAIANPDSSGVTSNLIPESSLRGDEEILRALRPTFLKLARALDGLVGVELQRIRERILRDREAFASAVEV